MKKQKATLEIFMNVLKTGIGTDGEKKDVVFAPNILLESLEKNEIKSLVRAMKETPVRVISFQIRSGKSRDPKNVPKQLRRLLGDDRLIGVIQRRKKGALTFISARLFHKCWAKNNVVDSGTEFIR